MRKVILYIAVTLDGYIADLNDGFDFLHEYDDITELQTSYHRLMERIDTLVMGRTTYQVVQAMGDWPYASLTSYVISHRQPHDSHPNVIWDSDPVALVHHLRRQPGRDIWLVGGGQLIKTFLEHDLIDEYQIALIPKMIGQGKPLFLPHPTKSKLTLLEVNRIDDIALLTYIRP